jgi:transposase
MGRPCRQPEVDESDRIALQALVRAGNTQRKVAGRARIILFFADGLTAEEIAAETGYSRNAVYRWRSRYEQLGLDGVRDKPRSGRPRTLSRKKVREILRRTVHEIPQESTHWSLRLMAEYAGVTVHQVRQVWQGADLKPHRIKSFKISNDPQFAEKVQDVVGLYLQPPENAMVLSVDEKTQIQALDRTQPLLPMRPGQIERRTHDYKRHGTRSLYAAFDIATGKVMGRVTRKHRAREFLAFLRQIDRAIDPALNLHMILDNSGTHSTPGVRAWLKSHPRFHLHFTPTSASWLNAVETWFSQLERRALHRGVFSNVTELRNEIHRYISVHNRDLAKPFKWTKSAQAIIASHDQFTDV